VRWDVIVVEATKFRVYLDLYVTKTSWLLRFGEGALFLMKY
jgi:hypothetical protein